MYKRWIAIFFILNVVLWGRHLFNFTINGDEVYMILEGPEYFFNFFSKLTDFSAQYRPIARLYYNLYYLLRHHSVVIYFIHLCLFTVTQFLFFLIAKRQLKSWKSFLLTLFVFFNPIFYYHIFTVASNINFFIIILLLAQILLLPYKKHVWIIGIFLFGLFIKETFILLIPVTIYSIFTAKLKRPTQIKLASFVLLMPIAFIIARFMNFVPTGGDYSFVFTFEKAKENIGNFIAWLINHPRREEFGFYGFRNIFNYLLDVLLLGLWCSGLYFTFKKKKTWFFVLIFTLALSLAPFVFLKRVLFFYMDIPFVVLGLLLIPALKTPKSSLIISTMLLSLVISYKLYFHKWLNYSFVGNSHFIAKNFEKTYNAEVRGKHKNICIINHHLGAWPTGEGRLAFFLDKEIESVTSIHSDDVSSCQEKFILKNDGAEYKPFLRSEILN